MRASAMLMMFGAALAAGADETAPLLQPDVSVLTLLPEARIAQGPVLLRDVLDFRAADARLRSELGAKSALETDTTGSIEVTHAQVVERLAGLGVNLARVMVQGALTCHVTVTSPRRSPADPAQGAADDLIVATPAATVATGDAKQRTLVDVLRQHIADELAKLHGEAEIEFERAGQEFLELTAPPWEFSIRSGDAEPLGLREYRVTLRRDARTHRTVKIMAQVRLLKPVLVAQRPLGIGCFVRPDDVALEPRLFEREQEIGLDRDDLVVGQQVKQFVPAGQMLTAGDVKPVELVKRSRPVTVTGAARNVQIQLTGVALDSGGYGDLVRVRMGDARRDRRELRGVVTGPGTVRLCEVTP